MARTRRRKKRTHIRDDQDPAKKGQPKSFVFRRGRHGAILKDLEQDFRKLMSPNTATQLKESKRNVLKDFVHVAGPLGVTHFLMLTATHNASYLRIGKPPRGPTLTLKIHDYSLIRDVMAHQQRPRMPQTMWLGPPLVVMNNFGGEEHMKLAAVTFQNLFPAINVQTTKLAACQRVLLLDYSKDTGRITMRHYSILVQPSGVTKNLKTLLARKDVPDMSRLADVSEFLTKSGYGSESEGEDAEQSRVVLPQEGGKGGKAGAPSRQSRVRLFEVGPRLELEVIKVEEGLCDGRVLYHRYVKKSAAEAAEQQSEMEAARKLKDQRRKQQDENVRKKQAKRKQAEGAEDGGKKAGDGKKVRREWESNPGGADEAPDDDVEYYKQEVGEEPEDMIGLNSSGRQRGEGGEGLAEAVDGGRAGTWKGWARRRWQGRGKGTWRRRWWRLSEEQGGLILGSDRQGR